MPFAARKASYKGGVKYNPFWLFVALQRYLAVVDLFAQLKSGSLLEERSGTRQYIQPAGTWPCSSWMSMNHERHQNGPDQATRNDQSAGIT